MRPATVLFIATVTGFRRRAAPDVQRIVGSLRRTFSRPPAAEVFYRHRLPVRVTHWINALCILFLLGSGLNIFNAHPRLYWGMYGADADKPFFSIGPVDAPRARKADVQIGPWRV